MGYSHEYENRGKYIHFIVKRLVVDIHLSIDSQVTSKLIDHIDGLCGYYNQKPHDDQRTPTGDLASSTQDFGKSWSVDPSLEAECAPVHCPISAQTAAWDKCSFLRLSLLFFSRQLFVFYS